MQKILILKKTIFSLLPLLIITILLETILRLFGFSYLPPIINTTAPIDQREIPKEGKKVKIRISDNPALHNISHPPPPPPDMVLLMMRGAKYDPLLFWELKPHAHDILEGLPRINPQGFRGQDFKKERNQKIRIACIGNSCTFGWQCNTSYPEILQEQINSIFNEEKVEVYNFAIPGYTSLQGYYLLKEKVLHYNPDFIVISYGWNDMFFASRYPDSYYNKGGASIAKIKRVFLHFRIYQLFMYAARPSRVAFKRETIYRRVPPSEFKKNLENIVSLCLKKKIIPIIFTEASMADFQTEEEADKKYPQTLKLASSDKSLKGLIETRREYNNILRETAKKYGIEMIDIAEKVDSLKETNLFLNANDPVHFSADGNKYIAKTVSERIIESCRP